MGLFNQILSAINDPEKQASTNQIGNIVSTIQQLSSNYDAQPNGIQSAMSIVGKYTRSSLQEKRQHDSEESVQNLINQFAGTQANNQALQLLFSNTQLQQMIGEIEGRTGLSKGTIQGILPVLVPLVLNFLKTGANKHNSLGNNPVLNSFLDADGDGDVDIADAIQMATKYL